ncbi:MAG: hypothetical protein ABI635_09180, partial [Actinomycetota bacterium]
GIQPQGSYGVADLFAVDPDIPAEGPFIRGGVAVELTDSNPDDVGFATGSAPDGATVVAAAPDAATGSATATVAGPASTTTRFSSDGGDLRLVPRIVAPQLLHIAERDSRDGTHLVLDRATTVRLDGRPVLGGALADIPLPAGRHAVAVASGDVFSPVVGGEALLGIGASGSLSAWGAAGELPWRGSWTQVRDCNDYDARSAQQTGLAAMTLAGAAGGVALDAASHSACVRSHVGESGSDGPLLVRFEYRSVAGRPARVCLWQQGPGRCAATPPLDASPGWHIFRAVLPADPDLAGTALFLYADGDAAGGVITHTEYRGMTLVRLARMARTAVRITPPEEQIVTVRAGDHELITQTRAPASLSPLPIAVEDCHAFDQRSVGQADLRATPLPDQPAPAIRLSARAHSACVSAPVAGFVPGGSYTVDLDYRTLQGLPARVCVWQDGPDRCAPMPKMEASGDWYHLHVAVTPEPGTAALRLFVYADAGAVGGDGTVVEYRALRVTSAAPLAVTMFDGDAGAPAPAVTWSALGGSAYQVEVAGSSRSFVLSLGESFAPGWRLDGVPDGRRVEHVVADGYANGWRIEPGAAFTARISFAPDRTIRAARAVSIGAGLAIPVLAIRRRRSGRTRAPADATQLDPTGRRRPPEEHRPQRPTDTPWSAPWW